MDYARLSVRKINQYINSLNEKDQLRFLDELACDKRISVRKLVEKYHKLREEGTLEKERLAKLWSLEKALYKKNIRHIVGIDEAGRGPLAGPVVASAVILPPFCVIEGLNDSKKLSAKKREEIAKKIKEEALAWAIGVVDAQTIDKLNILQGTRYAMKLALESLGDYPQYALVDGYKNPLLDIPQSGIIGGDSLSASIAAASIVAKVYRDKLMAVYDKIYPRYNFLRNKGYGTKEHLQALEKYGPSLIHRYSFKPVNEQNIG